MRLLKIDSDGELSFTEDLIEDHRLPPYAILSHTWNTVAGQEVLFTDPLTGSPDTKTGYTKIEFCRKQAQKDRLEYFWVDTCSIDKRNSAELTEAINSMFRWYQNASKCYVYLSDVSSSALGAHEEVSQLPCEPDFRKSRWFTRGWTLQELLAPRSVEFFSQEGNRIGDKASLGRLIHEITSIDVQALHGAPLEQFDVEKRFSWAKSRQTTRKEDEAYSLLGIFDVFMPLIYGEKGNAMQRLRELIDKPSSRKHAPPTQASNAKFVVPYTRNVDFIERPGILKDLKEQLGYGQAQGSAKPRSRVSLYGLGGAGKTQIALAYANWLRKECPDVSVFWVHASNEDRFRDAYTSIAKECGIPGYDDPKADILSLVKRWLDNKDRGRWLMVIDNADNTQLFFPPPQEHPNTHPLGTDPPAAVSLGRYIPECALGSVLVTTRNKQAGLRLTWGSPPIEVGRMTPSEAEQLIRSKIPGAEISAEETVLHSSKLENLPLALAQAAAFIQENSTSINHYIQLLDQGDNELVNRLSEPFQAVGRDSDTPHAVTATWIISFEQIQQQNAFTGEVLSLISLFDRQAIPTDFVADYYRRTRSPEMQSSEAAELTKALGTLKAFSLISDGKNQCVDMHRLVQLVTRKWLVNRGKIAEFAQYALEIVARAFPYWEFESREICTQYLPHADAVIKNDQTIPTAENMAGVTLQAKIAATYWSQGRYDEAEKLHLQVVEGRKRALGPDHPDTLWSISSLAVTYWSQGRYDEAEKLHLQAVEGRKQALGPDHPNTLWSIGDLAVTYWSQGRYDEAEKLELQVVEGRKRALGPDHPDTLQSIGGLAATYWSQGRYDEAEKLYLQVVEGRKRALGPDHPDTLWSISSLAVTYWSQGRYDEAEKLHLQAVEGRKQALGPDHPNTLWSIGDLAVTYWSQGRYDEAEKLELQVVEGRKRALGPDHPDTLQSIGGLAATYRSQGRYDEAEKLELQVVEGRKRALGPDHPDTLQSIGDLAATYWSQGRYDEAEKLDLQAVEGRKRALGPDHPDMLWSIGDLAVTYRSQGRYDEAEKLELQVVEGRKRALGPDHPDTLWSIGDLAVTYRSQGRYDEAEKLELQVVEGRKQALGPDHPDTLQSIGGLAATYRSQGRYDEAEKLELQVVEGRKRALGPDHPDTLRSIGGLAATYRSQGRYDEAEKLELQVVEGRKRALGPDHPDTLRSIGGLAATYRSQGRYDEAEKLELQVVEGRKQALGPDHPDTLQSIGGLAATYRGQGRYDEAEKLELQVVEGRKQALGPEDQQQITSQIPGAWVE